MTSVVDKPSAARRFNASGLVHSQSRDLPKKRSIHKSIPCLLLVEAGRIDSIERIFKGFTRFLGCLILLDFAE